MTVIVFSALAGVAGRPGIGMAGPLIAILFTIFEATEDEPGFVRILRVLHGAGQRLGQSQDQDDEDGPA